MANILTDNTLNALEKSLDLRLQRQELLAANLANIDTPGFKPHDMEFEGFLRKAQEVPEPEAATGVGMERTSAMHISPRDLPRTDDMPLDNVVSRPGVENSLDGNGVDLDEEVMRSTENAARYTAAAEMTRRKIAILNYAISSVK